MAVNEYVNNMINGRDTYNQIAYAREVGMEEGMAQGMDKAAVEALGWDKEQK